MAEQLATADSYIPQIEALGFEYLETEEFGGGVPCAVFRHATNGQRFLVPGVRGLPDEIPMVPVRKLDDLLGKARQVARQDGKLVASD